MKLLSLNVANMIFSSTLVFRLEQASPKEHLVSSHTDRRAHTSLKARDLRVPPTGGRITATFSKEILLGPDFQCGAPGLELDHLLSSDPLRYLLGLLSGHERRTLAGPATSSNDASKV